MSQPQLLPYATQEVNAVRFQRPFVVWSLILGVLGAGAVVADLVERSGDGFLSRLLLQVDWWRAWRLMEYSWFIQRLLSSVIGLLLAVAMLVAFRRDWLVNTTSLRVIRAAGVLLLITAVLELARWGTWLRQPMPVHVPLLQLVCYLAMHAVSVLFPAAVLIAASLRRFYEDRPFAQGLVFYGALAGGLAVTVLGVDQAIRWYLGTPPYWAHPDLSWLRGGSLRSRTVWLYTIQMIWTFPVQFFSGSIALLAALLALYSHLRRRPLGVVLVLAWLIPWMFSLATALAIQCQPEVSTSATAVAALLAGHALLLLLPVLAWCSVRGEAESA